MKLFWAVVLILAFCIVHGCAYTHSSREVNGEFSETDVKTVTFWKDISNARFTAGNEGSDGSRDGIDASVNLSARSGMAELSDLLRAVNDLQRPAPQE